MNAADADALIYAYVPDAAAFDPRDLLDVAMDRDIEAAAMLEQDVLCPPSLDDVLGGCDYLTDTLRVGEFTGYLN